MDSKKHVLFVCAEANPFAGTGGLGDVMGSLPKAINQKDLGLEARVIMPLYECVSHEFTSKLQPVKSIKVSIMGKSQYCGLYSLCYDGATYYFIDNEYYFKRAGIYGYFDDGERFTFFCRAVLELLPHLGWDVSILHCHDWHSALVPVYFKIFYNSREGYKGIKTVFTIHNLEYQGRFDAGILEYVFGIPKCNFSIVDFDGGINLLKGAIECSDFVTTVSPTYAQEIQQPYHSHGLQGILQSNNNKLRGIINGIDTDYYNPQANQSLFKNYWSQDFKNKKICKTELQKMLNLPVDQNIPMMGIVSRLADHKGFDLILSALPDIITGDVQLVVLGTGNPVYEQFFMRMQAEFNAKVRAIIAFNKDLSQKIYSGADIFLMPSKSEPCGLCQMIACRYGTVPIVRQTGGLKDTIKDGQNGFVFCDYDAFALKTAMIRALDTYNGDKEAWQRLMQGAMDTDFSWSISAQKYIDLYKELCS